MGKTTFSVGYSQSFDAVIAGEEATKMALSCLTEKPKLALFFCTIHYQKQRFGFKELLDSSKKLLENTTPLVGGNISGFICKNGCFSRGVVVVCAAGDDIQVNAFFANSIRSNPEKIASALAKKIISQVPEKNFRNKILFNFISGPKEPWFLSTKLVTKLIRSMYASLPLKLSWSLRDILTNMAMYFGYGPGFEEKVVSNISKDLNDYYLFGCSTFDDIKSLKHHQFIDNAVLDNAIVAMSIFLDFPVVLEHKLPLITTDKKFFIKRGWKNHYIDLVNNRPAASSYVYEMSWPKEYIQAHIEQVTKKTFYFPLGFREGGKIYPFPAGFFLGESIVSNREIRSDDIELFLTSNTETMACFNNILEKIKNKKQLFTFSVMGMNIIGMMGSKINLLKESLDKACDSSPYLVLFGSGENSKKPEEESVFYNYSIALLSILEKD